jgi:hypothetical protein
MALTGAGDPSNRAAMGVRDQVDLGGHATTATPQTLPVRNRLGLARFLVTRMSPLWASRVAALHPKPSARAPQRRRPWVADGGLQHCGDGRGSRCHPRSHSTAHHRRCRSPPAAHPARCATSRPLTSDDAGCTPSSSCRITPANPATATPSGSATSPRPRQAGDPSNGHPGSGCGPATTAREPPTDHRSSHDGYAQTRSIPPRPQDRQDTP